MSEHEPQPAHDSNEPATPVVSTAPLTPVAERERIAALDVLRGFALFGIFMVNMQFFAMPFMRAMFDPSMADASALEQLSWAFVKVFFEYKFVTLFSLMFGMGLAVQLVRAQRAGRRFRTVYARRLIVLALIGGAHAVLLWFGDILLFYACIGTVLLLCITLSARHLLMLSAATFLIGVLLMTAFSALQVLASTWEQPATAARDVNQADDAEQSDSLTAPTDEETVAPETAEPTPPLRGFDAMRAAQFDPSRDVWVQAETAAFKEGTFLEATLFRAIGYAFALIAGVFGFFWHILAMFFLGAALVKLDFFSPRRKSWHIAMVAIALPIGLGIESFVTWMHYRADFGFGWHMVPGVAMHEFGSVALALGYAGLICLLVSSGVLGALWRGLACVGRMSLTNYLSQTVITTFLMYGWGLGWFGDVPRSQQIVIVFVVFAGQIVFSVLWLRLFSIGPMEWLWRTITYLKLQPIIRRNA